MKTLTPEQVKWLLEYLEGQHTINESFMEPDDLKELREMIEFLKSDEVPSASSYGKIRKLWEQAGDDITKPPHLQKFDDEARTLDQALGEKFKEPIKQWEDGLIASIELVDKVMWASFQE